MMQIHKKGSLELSVNAIIIVVLAMTLLGLGLGFIRNMFQNITSTTTDVQTQVREQITTQLRSTGEKISFSSEVQFNRNEQKVITLGVQNTGTTTLFYKINVSLDPSNSDVIAGQSPFSDANLRYDRSCKSLVPSDADVVNINARAPSVPGTFALRADIESFTDSACTTEQGSYASKLSFITVG